MNRAILEATAQALVGGGKGLLAMDESIATCNKRFAALGIPQTEDARRAYRELLVTTPSLGAYVSGAILFDETIRQSDRHGARFVDRLNAAGVIPGIKVDMGAKDLALHPGEKITEGLDGLRARLHDYARTGARFAKWRAVLGVGDGIPSTACIVANAHALARYAALCQEAGLVPIVEPEVLMAGCHTLRRCGEVTHMVLRAVFDALDAQGVELEAMILKPNMVLPGQDCPEQDGIEAVARATLNCLQQSVPAAVAGVAFLSGGQSAELASARLNAMNRHGTPAGRSPWPLVFSFGRALQQPALQIWRGQDANVVAAQRALIRRATCNGVAPQRRVFGIDGARTCFEDGVLDRMHPAPLRLYLIRHGETAWSLTGQHTGRTDLALTPHGEAEARALEPVLRAIAFDCVLTSPARRAQDTCALAGLGTSAEVEPDLAEWDYGAYEGRTSVDIRRDRPSWNVFRDGCPGGESVEAVTERADRVIGRVAALHGNVALFSSGQFGCTLAARWIGLPVLQAQHLMLDTASVSVLAYNPHHPDLRVIAHWNRRSTDPQ